MKKPIYKEGTIFLVPLTNGLYARGVIARASQGGVLYGYFFGPPMSITEKVDMTDLQPDKSCLQLRFGALGLDIGTWKIIGPLPDWDRTKWVMPDFLTGDPRFFRKAWITRYSDKNPGKTISSIETNFEDTPPGSLPKDTLAGYIAAQIRLSRVLGIYEDESAPQIVTH